MTTATLAVLGRLLATAFACGLNLYATVALLGGAARLGMLPGLPPGLDGLRSTAVIASATALYVIGFAADRIPGVDSVWDTVHSVIRPAAATLLALAALATLPWNLRIAGAAAAGGIALTAHAARAGLRMTRNARPSATAPVGTRLAEDAAAVLLVLLAVLRPLAALALAGSATIALLAARPLWRAFLLGPRSILARLRGFFGADDWLDILRVPADLRALLEPAGPGSAAHRAARAVLNGAPGVGAYRNGWLVLGDDSPSFLYRSFFRPRRLVLAPLRSASVRPGEWVDILDLETSSGDCTVFLLKDGPSAHRAAADLAPTDASSRPPATAARTSP